MGCCWYLQINKEGMESIKIFIKKASLRVGKSLLEKLRGDEWFTTGTGRTFNISKEKNAEIRGKIIGAVENLRNFISDDEIKTIII